MTPAEEIKDLYDFYCEYYDEHMKKTGHYSAQLKIINEIVDEIEEPILDLACGSGFLLSHLSNRFSNISANDFSKKMTGLAKKKNQKIAFTNDNSETLESYDQKFNTIICCNLFFYIQNRNKAIARWKGLLNKKGKIIFIEEHPFIKPKPSQMDEFARRLMKLVKPISPEEISDLMHRNGFISIKETKDIIDDEHNLYGLVFKLK
jgi:ubiquinone/menaquinone biosynthesis C-methylase UbiE